MSDSTSQSSGTTSQPSSPDVDFVALKPGQTIGRYEIVAVLGQGGFGITYRARDVQLGREVAIKEYLPSALAVRQGGTTVLPRTTKMSEDFTWGRERFVTEGRTLASLHRVPAIVQVFDFLEANGTAYIVMELVHGDTLEDRIARNGKLSGEEVDRILWPLLDGLERVHNAGFLHRDIKPANILLDQAGNPTLIDFGASRAAMAGRSTALTAIFTPGYAAAEQMTSAKQGPWTDIYGLSATLYHAITGHVPPSAFDRMLTDAYEPLASKAPPGFGRGLLAGLDAGLALRATDRPQSIAGWRPILGQSTAPAADVTVALARAPQPAMPPTPPPVAPSPQPKRRIALWLGAALAALVLLAGGYYALVDERHPRQTVSVDKAAQDTQLATEAQRLKDQEELARLRAEAAAREKAEQEANQRRQIEEETRRKVEAEMATRQREQEEARRKAEAEATARAPSAALPSQPAQPQPPQTAAVAPPVAPVAPAAPVAPVAPVAPAKAGPDGLWQGTYRCTPSRHGSNFTMNLQINVVGGTGTWVRPGSGPGTTGNQSLTIRINGPQVAVARVFSPQNQIGVFSTGTMTARYEGTTITGSGPEHDSGGRNCDLSLTKVR